MNNQWILLSAHEYPLLGQTEGGKEVFFWKGQGAVQGEIILKNTLLL